MTFQTREEIQQGKTLQEYLPFPTSLEEMLGRYEAKPKDLHDLVREIHVKLFETDPEYRKLLKATTNETSVEGTTRDDHGVAAMRVRAFAAADEGVAYRPVANASIKRLRFSLTVNMRKYKMARTQRPGVE